MPRSRSRASSPPRAASPSTAYRSTVNEVRGPEFGVNIIPHTAAITTFGLLKVGDPVNIEIDTVARYVARLTEYR